MQKRDFGPGGTKITPLSFGAMRVSPDAREATPVIRRAIDLGVNYVDTAPFYIDHKSEGLVGEALQDGYREKVYLSTKCPVSLKEEYDLDEYLQQSLERLQTDYIDYYHLWSLNGEKYREKVLPPGGFLEKAIKAREKGLIRNISFSFHGEVEDLEKIIQDGHFSTMLVQYNILNRENEKAISMARQKGMGVAVMGPVAGGRLARPSRVIEELLPRDVSTSAELALRFVLANPDVSTAISGMENTTMVEENIETASRPDPLTPAELEKIKSTSEELQALARLYCTSCGYCMPCPHEVNIPAIFQLMNYYRVYDIKDYAREIYDRMKNGSRFAPQGKTADYCIECGECLEKCPQDINIIEQLREAEETLKE